MGAYLSEPIKEKVFEEGNNHKFDFCAVSMQGWRTSMEDTHIADVKLDQDTALFGVFDGHGGSEVAKYVKKNFVDELKKNANFKNRKDLDKALREAFISIDKQMITKEGIKELFSYSSLPSQSDNNYDLTQLTAGCTANVALFYKNQLFVANSGDSRSVLCSKGEPYEMSKDHKPENPEEEARIREAGGFVSNKRVQGNLSLSRAMGDFEYKDLQINKGQQVYPAQPEKCMITVVPEVRQKDIIATDQFLLIGCDGIWECKTNEELIEFVKIRLDKKVKLTEILTDLLEDLIATNTQEGIGCDNMTAIIVVIKKI